MRGDFAGQLPLGAPGAQERVQPEQETSHALPHSSRTWRLAQAALDCQVEGGNAEGAEVAEDAEAQSPQRHRAADPVPHVFPARDPRRPPWQRRRRQRYRLAPHSMHVQEGRC